MNLQSHLKEILTQGIQRKQINMHTLSVTSHHMNPSYVLLKLGPAVTYLLTIITVCQESTSLPRLVSSWANSRRISLLCQSTHHITYSYALAPIWWQVKTLKHQLFTLYWVSAVVYSFSSLSGILVIFCFFILLIMICYFDWWIKKNKLGLSCAKLRSCCD